MEIVLKSLHLVNFKGARDLELSFSPGTSLVKGDNGTGKTTVFDAFTWLLFGKDSTQRSDSNFNIKTLDSQGNPILKQEHSVTALLMVDGLVAHRLGRVNGRFLIALGLAEVAGGLRSDVVEIDVGIG